jgi:hypothetical protein
MLPVGPHDKEAGWQKGTGLGMTQADTPVRPYSVFGVRVP